MDTLCFAMETESIKVTLKISLIKQWMYPRLSISVFTLYSLLVIN